MDQRPKTTREGSEIERDRRANEAARREVLRRDGERSPGENIERADALIKTGFEIRDAFSETRT